MVSGQRSQNGGNSRRVIAVRVREEDEREWAAGQPGGDRFEVRGIADARIDERGIRPRQQVGVGTGRPRPHRRVASRQDNHSEIVFQPQVNEVTLGKTTREIVPVTHKPSAGTLDGDVVTQRDRRNGAQERR